MDYQGWNPKPSPAGSPADHLERVQIAELTPEVFYERYVAARRPCVLLGELSDPQWRAGRLWTANYLVESIPEHLLVRAERRDSERSSFGLGQTRDIPFRELMLRLHPCLKQKQEKELENQEHDDRPSLWYMTTQNIPDDESGMHPSLLHGPPLGELAADFPARPSLLGNLVPWQYNLWLGGAVQPKSKSLPATSSSGLHHDFHDNLYVLLRGAKRFTLFSPGEAPKMPMYGRIRRVFPNGLVAYDQAELDAGLRADGALAEDVLKTRIEKIEFQIEQVSVQRETLLGQLTKPERKRLNQLDTQLAQLNTQLDELLEASLDQQWENALDEGDEGDQGDEGDEGDERDFGLGGDESEAGLMTHSDGDGKESDERADEDRVDKELEAALNAEFQRVRRRGKPGKRRLEQEAEADEDSLMSAVLGDNWGSMLDILKGQQQQPTGRSRPRKRQKTGVEPAQLTETKLADNPHNFPDHFCRLTSAELLQQQQASHPPQPIVAELRAGEMLFLPAGWFHEVESSFDPEQPAAAAPQTSADCPCPVHMAFNFWFHPPDRLPSDGGSFHQPYADDHWEHRWQLHHQAPRSSQK